MNNIVKINLDEEAQIRKIIRDTFERIPDEDVSEVLSQCLGVINLCGSNMRAASVSSILLEFFKKKVGER